MNRLQTSVATAAIVVMPVLLSCANGQEQGTPGATPGQTGAQGAGAADRMAGMGQSQTFTGVLLDANCSGLASIGTGMSGTAGAGAAGGIQDSSGVARPGAPGPGGAASPTAGTGPATAGETRPGEKGTGRPGAEGGTARPGDETATGARASAGQTGAGHGSAGMAGALSPEIRNCMATSTTSSYALYSDGRVIRLDPESNSKIQQHIQSEQKGADRARAGAAAAAEPTHVTVQGQLQLKVDSVQPMRGLGQDR